MRAPELLMITTAYAILEDAELDEVIKLLDSKRLKCSNTPHNINKIIERLDDENE